MSRLEVRLLGGLDIRLDGEPVQGFESQKVRALFAYLLVHREQAVSREQLAALLWAEKDEAAARRNLRQALHNLRATFAAAGWADDLLDAGLGDLKLLPGEELWIDLPLFQAAVRRGLEGQRPDPYHLGLAARLYSGDLLAGFYIRDSPPFEEWLLAHQEQARDDAIAAFRALVQTYLRRGDSRLGIQFARRLLAIDPLSEEAHRDLIKLYALSGRRTRALAQYEELRNLLNAELGVEPLEETTALYQSILLEEAAPEEQRDEPIGPVIPLAGRSREVEELEAIWERVVSGGARLTLIAGEGGVGKTRLLRSVVDLVSSKRRLVVLGGRCYPDSPLVPFRPFREMLASVFADLVPDGEVDTGRLGAAALATLARLVPEPARSGGGLPLPSPSAPPLAPGALAAALEELVAVLARDPQEGGRARPVILMVDNLQWTDGASLELLGRLLPALAERPVWVLAGLRTGGEEEQALAGLFAAVGEERVDRVALGRLGEEEVEEIAEALVGDPAAAELGAYLMRWSGGLPLPVTELINFLWDEGSLMSREPGRWSLATDLDATEPPPRDWLELMRLRFRRLPSSARRLLAFAAVIGHRFDAELLQQAADETLGITEQCIRLMLERWLIRQFPRSWTTARRDRDLVLWAKGARRGSFEFAHEAIRRAVLEEVHPLRKQAMHRALARSLRRIYADDPEAICEKLAHHELEAGEWQRALPCLERAGRKARAVGAEEVARRYDERRERVAERLAGRTGPDSGTPIEGRRSKRRPSRKRPPAGAD